MNRRPLIVAVCAIIAMGAVLIMAAGSGGKVNPKPRGLWTVTYSIPASNSTGAFQTNISIAPQTK
jgi:hypothetical protein